MPLRLWSDCVPDVHFYIWIVQITSWSGNGHRIHSGRMYIQEILISVCYDRLLEYFMDEHYMYVTFNGQKFLKSTYCFSFDRIDILHSRYNFRALCRRVLAYLLQISHFQRKDHSTFHLHCGICIHPEHFQFLFVYFNEGNISLCKSYLCFGRETVQFTDIHLLHRLHVYRPHRLCYTSEHFHFDWSKWNFNVTSNSIVAHVMFNSEMLISLPGS
jgi:hypothetical protein